MMLISMHRQACFCYAGLDMKIGVHQWIDLGLVEVIAFFPSFSFLFLSFAAAPEPGQRVWEKFNELPGADGRSINVDRY